MLSELARRLRLYRSMIAYGRAHGSDFAREHVAFFGRMCRELEMTYDDFEGLEVLDVGCGKMMWLTVLLHSLGARATGVDTEYAEPRRSLGKYLRILRSNGLERCLRTLAWDFLYAPMYYAELARYTPFELRLDGVRGRQMAGEGLGLEGDRFDLVVSHEVFEHIEDVEGAAREVRRVMKPGGRTYIYIHNYTSISGGHHIAWKYPDTEPSDSVPAWDHLRENRYPDIPSWINRWRESQYREVFERELEIEKWVHTEREGEALLTPEIRAELAEYSENELLTKGFVVVARKPAPEEMP